MSDSTLNLISSNLEKLHKNEYVLNYQFEPRLPKNKDNNLQRHIIFKELKEDFVEEITNYGFSPFLPETYEIQNQDVNIMKYNKIKDYNGLLSYIKRKYTNEQRYKSNRQNKFLKMKNKSVICEENNGKKLTKKINNTPNSNSILQRISNVIEKTKKINVLDSNKEYIDSIKIQKNVTSSSKNIIDKNNNIYESKSTKNINNGNSKLAIIKEEPSITYQNYADKLAKEIIAKSKLEHNAEVNKNKKIRSHNASTSSIQNKNESANSSSLFDYSKESENPKNKFLINSMQDIFNFAYFPIEKKLQKPRKLKNFKDKINPNENEKDKKTKLKLKSNSMIEKSEIEELDNNTNKGLYIYNINDYIKDKLNLDKTVNNFQTEKKMWYITPKINKNNKLKSRFLNSNNENKVIHSKINLYMKNPGFLSTSMDLSRKTKPLNEKIDKVTINVSNNLVREGNKGPIKGQKLINGKRKKKFSLSYFDNLSQYKQKSRSVFTQKRVNSAKFLEMKNYDYERRIFLMNQKISSYFNQGRKMSMNNNFLEEIENYPDSIFNNYRLIKNHGKCTHSNKHSYCASAKLLSPKKTFKTIEYEPK